MSKRMSNARVEVAGLKLVGTVKNVDTGGVKNNPSVNGDGSVDTYEELVPAMLEIDLSMVSDSETAAIQAITNEPMLVTFSNKQKINFPSMTFSEKGPIGDQGVMNVKFVGGAVG